MFLQCPLQVFLLWTAFLFQDFVDSCERPAWSTVGWDIPLQDLKQMSEEQSDGIHSSLCQICHKFTSMGLSKECLHVLSASCKVALFIAVLLSLFYLLHKLKIITREKGMIEPPVLSAAIKVPSEHTPNTDRMLFRLVANTSKMMKYMKHVAHYYRKEVRHHKLSKRKKVEDIDDEQLFPVCSHHHSSSEDSMMRVF